MERSWPLASASSVVIAGSWRRICENCDPTGRGDRGPCCCRTWGAACAWRAVGGAEPGPGTGAPGRASETHALPRPLVQLPLR